MATFGLTEASPLSESEHQVQLRRAVIASTIGTAIEWYDFFLYSTVTGLVFAKLFFPQLGPAGRHPARPSPSMPSAFIARPIGAAIFGHYGDRIGRKSTLIATLLLMGLATFAVALVPTYASIGIWGAVILTVLRFIQGIGVGGEWGGSVLMSMEWARDQRSSRLYRVLAAIRRSLRTVPGQSRRAGLQPDVRRAVPDLGLAHSRSPEHRPGRRRPLHPARHPRNAGLLEAVAERKIERTPMLAVIKRHPKEIILSRVGCAWPSRPRSISSPPSSFRTASTRCTSRATSC